MSQERDMSSTDETTDLQMAHGTGSEADTPATRAAGETNELREAIAKAIADHDVILFMKGTPEAPACGFSARTVAALAELEVPFAAVDILPDPRIRMELSALSNWPTIPQLFAHGELIGGCDIVCEMHESGELEDALR
jgi:monothiol glutaredoxin